MFNFLPRLMLALVLFSTAALADRQVTDQLNRQVTLPDHITRAVVLQHQTLNLLVQLDAMPQVVGVLSSWKKQLGPNYLRLAPTLATLPMPGDHNVSNALSAVAVARHLGMKRAEIRTALAKFGGVGRRFTRYGEVSLEGGGSFTLVDDFGHHPVETEVTERARERGLPDSALVRAPGISTQEWAIDPALSDPRGQWRPASGDARWRVETWRHL